MVTQNKLRTCEGNFLGKNIFKFVTTVDLNKCFKQIKLQFLLFTCAPISELLSNLSTVCPGSSDPT